MAQRNCKTGSWAGFLLFGAWHFLTTKGKNPSVSVKRLGFFISFFLPTKVLTFKGANVFQKGDQEFTNVCCNLCIVLVLATVYSWIDLLLNA